MTLVAGKQRSLLMAADDDEMYDKKHQQSSIQLYAVVNLKPK